MDKKILVVDDAMFMRSIIRKILKDVSSTSAPFVTVPEAVPLL